MVQLPVFLAGKFHYGAMKILQITIRQIYNLSYHFLLIIYYLSNDFFAKNMIRQITKMIQAIQGGCRIISYAGLGLDDKPCGVRPIRLG